MFYEFKLDFSPQIDVWNYIELPQLPYANMYIGMLLRLKIEADSTILVTSHDTIKVLTLSTSVVSFTNAGIISEQNELTSLIP